MRKDTGGGGGVTKGKEGGGPHLLLLTAISTFYIAYKTNIRDAFVTRRHARFEIFVEKNKDFLLMQWYR